MAFNIIGHVPHNAFSEQPEARRAAEIDLPWISECARIHERAGFDSVLIGHDAWRPNAWLLAAHIAAQTERLGVCIAERPGTALPTYVARQAITLERLAGRGRVTLHVVTGGSEKDQRRDGDQIDYARRYDRCAEYLDIVRQTWHAAAPFDYQGDYFQLREAWSPAQPLAHGSIGLSFAGTSEEALDLSARYADMHMLWGEPLAETAQKVAALQQRAAAQGRQLQFSISQRAIVEDSEKLAWEKAEHLYQQALKQLGTKADQPADFKLDMQQSASARQLNELAARRDIYDERLWMKYARVLKVGGSTTALVGTAEQVAEAFLRYRELGVSAWYLRGWDIAEDARRYGEQLIPLLRARVAAAEEALS